MLRFSAPCFAPGRRSRIAAAVVAGLTSFNIASAAMTPSKKSVVYAALGDRRTRYELDVAKATLTPRETILTAENVQFAVAASATGCLYVVSSNAGSGSTGAAGDKHFLSVYKISRASGALALHGQPANLPERPIHLAVDATAKFALVAFNQSGTLRVYAIKSDGTIGAEIHQLATTEGGRFAHQ